MHNDKQPFSYKSVHVKETCKISEISDAFNQLKYKVIMSSFDIVDDGKYQLVYQIQVVNYFTGPEPLIIFEAPDLDEPVITDLKVATKIYNDCVQNYTALVKAETRDLQDIDVYKEKIEYKEICPECCATCKWCKSKFNDEIIHDKEMYHFGPKDKFDPKIHDREIQHFDPKELSSKDRFDPKFNHKSDKHEHNDLLFSRKMLCVNPKNIDEYKFDMYDCLPDDFARHTHEERHGHVLQPYDHAILKLKLKVMPFGICKHYEKFQK